MRLLFLFSSAMTLASPLDTRPLDRRVRPLGPIADRGDVR